MLKLNNGKFPKGNKETNKVSKMKWERSCFPISVEQLAETITLLELGCEDLMGMSLKIRKYDCLLKAVRRSNKAHSGDPRSPMTRGRAQAMTKKRAGHRRIAVSKYATMRFRTSMSYEERRAFVRRKMNL